MDYSALSSEQASEGRLAEFASLPGDYSSNLAANTDMLRAMSADSLPSAENMAASMENSYGCQGHELISDDKESTQSSLGIPDHLLTFSDTQYYVEPGAPWQTQSEFNNAQTDDDQDIPSVRVLSHLDSILRDKVQQGIDQFHVGLHHSLDTHLCHVQHLLNLSQYGLRPTSPALPPAPPETMCGTAEVPDASTTHLSCDRHDSDSCCHEMAVSMQKTEYLAQLLTKACIITNTLHRKEFAL